MASNIKIGHVNTDSSDFLLLCLKAVLLQSDDGLLCSPSQFMFVYYQKRYIYLEKKFNKDTSVLYQLMYYISD